MRNLVDRILRSPDDPAAAPPAAAGDPPTTPGLPAPATPPAPAPAPAGNNPVTPPPAATPPAGEIYRPEGLPEHLLGKNDRETIDSLAKALNGYRQKDNERGVPQEASAYATFGDDVPDVLKPHVETLTKDPLFERVAQSALKLGIPVKDYQTLTTEFLSVSAEMGLLEPPIDAEAEKAALVPAEARHLTPAEQTAARERRMNANFAFLDQMATRENGGLSKEAAEHAKTMLGDSAHGHEFIEFVQKLGGSGEGPRGNDGGNQNGDARTQLQAEAALPQNTPGHAKFDRKSYEALQEKFKKAFPD